MRIPFLSRFGAAWRDLRDFFATREKHQYLFAFISLAFVVLLVAGFYVDSDIKPQPRIYYMYNWPANRTDAEIIADQKKDSAAKHAAQAERQAEYRRLADRLGIK
jgi:hypothetical protein